MRRLEFLKVREQNMVNQINPPQMPNPSCTYYHALTQIFEECPVYQAQQMLPDGMNASFTRSNSNPYSKTYNPGWRNHPNFSWSQSSPEQPRQNFPHQFNAQSHQSNFQPNYQHNFQSTFQQQHHPEKKMSDEEKVLETLSKTQASMMNSHNQAINRLELQISQLTNSLNERQKGILPSQPLLNPKNSFPIHESEDITLK